MANREIKFNCPAHIIYEGKDDWEGYKDGDVIAIEFQSRNHGTLHHFYTLGSVVHYAIKNCECPFEGVERAKKNGHKLHWANQNSTMITSHAREQDVSFMQEHGDEIRFHGKTFKIVPTANDNIDLKLVE